MVNEWDCVECSTCWRKLSKPPENTLKSHTRGPSLLENLRNLLASTCFVDSVAWISDTRETESVDVVRGFCLVLCKMRC